MPSRKKEPYVIKSRELQKDYSPNVEKGNIPTFKFSLGDPVAVVYEQKPGCRALEDFEASDVLKLDFSAIRMAPRETEKFIMERIENGVQLISGLESLKTFHFFGCSNSQLKDHKTFLVRRSEKEIEELLNSMGDFTMNSVAKRTKRMGLLFSNVNMIGTLDPIQVVEIDDLVTESGELLTDGCGFVSEAFAKRIARQTNLVFRQDRYLPSVFQFRYLGYKGVLALEPNLPKRVAIQCRPSMRKFKNASDPVFGLVKASKPYAFGALNAEHVTLLVELGIKPDTLVHKQKEYHEFLLRAMSNIDEAFKLFVYRDQFPQAERLIEQGLPTMQSEIHGSIRRELAKTVNRKGDRRVRIVLIQSRLLFGIAEPASRLQHGEVFVRITVNGLPQTLTDGSILVTRNPCLHPGDFRHLKLVDIEEYHHLVDCIVFSTSSQLEQSHAGEMSGGDLDGDEFMVIFDHDLQPTKVYKPYEYPPAKVKVQGGITRRDMLLYFARFNNSSVGRIKNLYLRWVNERGAQCKQALELNALFSACIDGKRISIPDKLLSAPEASQATANFIVNRLLADSEKFINSLAFSSLQAAPSNSMPYTVWESLVFDNFFQGLSSFEVFRFIQKCKRLDTDQKIELYLGVDFTSFTVAQKEWSIQTCPSLQPLLLNAVYQSKLLPRPELDCFGLPLIGKWKRFYTSSLPGPAFQDRMLSGLSGFVRKLIVFNAGPRLTVALFIQQRLEQGNNALNTLHVYSTDKNRFHSHVELNGFCLDLDQHLVQIYRSGKPNTFLWMSMAASERDASKGVVGRVSVNLNRIGNHAKEHFDLIKKQPLNEVEIFVLTGNESRDIEIRHYPIAPTPTIESPPVYDAGSQSCREYNVYQEDDWLKTTMAIPELVSVIRHNSHLSQVDMDDQMMERLLSQASKYHLSEVAADALLLFPVAAQVAFHHLTELPYLGIPLLLMGKQPSIEILHGLLRCLNDPRWGALALEHIFNVVPKLDLSPQLEFLTLSTCASSYATELRRRILDHYLNTGDNVDANNDAMGIFVDLHCTLQEGAQHRGNPTMRYIQLQAKDKDGEYVFERDLSTVFTPPRRGDVWLFEAMRAPVNLPDYRWPPFVGVVQDIEEYSLVFDFHTSWVPHNIEFVDWNAWSIGNITTARTMWEASSFSHLSRGPVADSGELYTAQSLNESQRKALETALTEQVSLVWGPPAVGKTFTVVQLLQGLARRRERVLITASTHQAVDNILRKLVEQSSSASFENMIVRLGDMDQIDAACHRWTVDMHPLMKHKNVSKATKVVKRIVQEARLVFSTVTGAGLGVLRKDHEFDTVVVDEAGQVTQSNTRIATCKAQRRVVLVGDHQQLHATVHEQAKELGFDVSMFEHLIKKDYPCVMLDVQYRMHPSLIQFSSERFYGGKIQSAPTTHGIRPLKSTPWAGKNHVVWVDVARGREKRTQRTSFANDEEAEQIGRIIRSLLQAKECRPEDIGVITGYSGQVQCVRKHLAQGGIPKSITVRTVDGFQGQERRVIIFSAVRTERNVGFLKDHHRMNVMLTRAKEGLAVVARKATLELDPLWKEWIRQHPHFRV